MWSSSTLVAFFLFLCRTESSSPEDDEGEVLFSTHGRVGGGNYTYYTLTDEAPVSLVLDSIQGDADLYVSDVVSKPSFDLSEHWAASVTCGQDQVDLPRTVKRPVHVAVYGHPRFEVRWKKATDICSK